MDELDEAHTAVTHALGLVQRLTTPDIDGLLADAGQWIARARTNLTTYDTARTCDTCGHRTR